jgi:hypothetical protein
MFLIHFILIHLPLNLTMSNFRSIIYGLHLAFQQNQRKKPTKI